MRKSKVKNSHKRIAIILTAVFLVTAFSFIPKKTDLEEKIENVTFKNTSISPSPQISTVPEQTLKPEPTPLPKEVDIDLPFASQAPFGKWDHTHEETCEEAAVLIAAFHKKKLDFASNQEAEDNLQDIIEWEKANLNGTWESTTAEETLKILTDKFSTSAFIENDPTIDSIKKHLADGEIVLAPSAGRILNNPYYTAPGPVFHYIVLKGYTNNNMFITHDPGTKHGANYKFDIPVVMNAIHDWIGQDATILDGPKKVIIVTKD